MKTERLQEIVATARTFAVNLRDPGCSAKMQTVLVRPLEDLLADAQAEEAEAK